MPSIRDDLAPKAPYRLRLTARSRIIDTRQEPIGTRWGRLDTAMLVLVTAAAAVLRIPSLSRPVELVFDEIFYARDACWYVYASQAVCDVEGLVSRSHPPLGKWLIGSGIAAFGYDPFGWRVAAAVVGTLSVALLFLLARRLLGRAAPARAATVGATAAAGLLATDFLHLVHSRVAMLDVFITAFVIGAVLAIVIDRDRVRDRSSASWWDRLLLGRPWRLLAGVCLGAATATKWSGAYVAPAVIGLVVAWEIAASRRREPHAGAASWIRRAFRREAVPTFVLLGIVPLLVYLASYVGRMPGDLVGLPWEAGTVWRGIWDHQRAMLDFHTALGGDHPYQSPPWSWITLKRPVAYWFSAEGGTYREIMALGSPAVWWPGALALLGLVVTWSRSGWRLGRPEPVILAAAAATYLPWIVLSGDRSQVFIWYILPTIPFLCLALGFFAALAWRSLAGRIVGAVYGVAVVGTFVFYLPLLVGLPLEPDAWQRRILLADCAGAETATGDLPDDSTSQGRPPDGWCWI